MSEWISVKDMLPELKDNGDVYIHSDFVLCANIPADNHMAAPEIWIFFLEQEEGEKPRWAYIGENNPGEITHWMPLPSPPKE